MLVFLLLAAVNAIVPSVSTVVVALGTTTGVVRTRLGVCRGVVDCVCVPVHIVSETFTRDAGWTNFDCVENVGHELVFAWIGF